ncbi:MAG: AAA family ATPase [Pseudomonadota bacterium]
MKQNKRCCINFARIMDKNHVLVVDEAGMVGTNQMAQIVKHVNESGAKLILVGDDQQLQAVGAGGPLKGIKEEVGFVSLTDVRRQTFILKEQVSTIAFLVEKDLLKEYVQRRFNLSISRKL